MLHFSIDNMWRQLFIIIFISVIESLCYSHQELKCLVCTTATDELMKQVEKVSPTREVKVGGYRVDGDGNVKQKSVPMIKSELFLSELLDSVCEKMDDYVRATDKKTGALALIRLIMESGGMNPNITDYDIIQDSDLNKSLQFECEGVVGEFETEFYRVLSTTEDLSQVKRKYCVEETRLCSKDHMQDTKEEL